MGNVVSNCSFSKIFSPGIRLGWIEAPCKVVKLLHTSGVAMSGGGFNHLMSLIMNSVISLGYLDDIVVENRAIVKVLYIKQEHPLTQVIVYLLFDLVTG